MENTKIRKELNQFKNLIMEELKMPFESDLTIDQYKGIVEDVFNIKKSEDSDNIFSLVLFMLKLGFYNGYRFRRDNGDQLYLDEEYTTPMDMDKTIKYIEESFKELQ